MDRAKIYSPERRIERRSPKQGGSGPDQLRIAGARNVEKQFHKFLPKEIDGFFQFFATFCDFSAFRLTVVNQADALFALLMTFCRMQTAVKIRRDSEENPLLMRASVIQAPLRRRSGHSSRMQRNSETTPSLKRRADCFAPNVAPIRASAVQKAKWALFLYAADLRVSDHLQRRA